MATTIDALAVVHGGTLHHGALKLADQAVRRALAVDSVDANDVDLLVNAGLFHDRILGEPALAALIQEDVGANPEDPHGDGHGTFSFDVANGAAGVLSALQIVDGFLRAGTIRRAVVVAGDADPGHGMAPGFPYDPAGAALVCSSDGTDDGFVGFRWLTCPDAPARRDATIALDHGRNHLLVREDEAFAAEAAAVAGQVATELLAEHGLRPGDIAAVAAAPFDATFIDALTEHLAVPADRFARPGPARWHTAGLVAALDAVTAGPPAADGEWILLVAAGAGISAGAALLRR